MVQQDRVDDLREIVATGDTALGIELGSTRIKACLVGPDGTPLASGSHEWENEYVDRTWTYSLESVREGMQHCYAELVADVERRYGVRPTTFGAIGVSAMMHGYLAFDARRRAARAVPDLAEHDDGQGGRRALRAVRPQHPAALVRRPPVPGDPRRRAPRGAGGVRSRRSPGYVHRRLDRAARCSGSATRPACSPSTRRRATTTGACSRSSTGSSRRARPGSRLEPPAARGPRRGAGRREPDRRGRGLARPHRRAPRRASRCARPRVTPARAWSRRTRSRRARATSARARASSRWSCSSTPLAARHHELDLVTTPAGDLVAMVHCNNGASELARLGRPVRRVRGRARARPRRPTTCSARSCAPRSTATPTAAGCSRTTTSRASRSPASRKGARWSSGRPAAG